MSEITDYLRPGTVDEALSMLGSGTRVVAGGTDVILHPGSDTRRLVDISGLPLDAITGDAASGIRIGALATLTAVGRHPGLDSGYGGVVADTIVHVGSPLLRNVATIGGHVARGILSDIVPVLVALDAIVEYSDGATHRVPLETFYRDVPDRRALLVTAIELPAGPEVIGAYERFSRTAFDLALISCSVALEFDGGTVADARIVFGTTPRLFAPAAGAGEALRGMAAAGIDTRAIARLAAGEVEFDGDGRASADYRRHLAEVMAARSLERAVGTGASS